jgi:hypothetical protein
MTLGPIGGSSGSDAIRAVEAVIATASLCRQCIVARTALPDRDVEIAVRVLIRTSGVQLADVCDSCDSASTAFTGPMSNRDTTASAS